MINDDIQETIRGYINNTLPTDERAQFEQAMATDAELKSEVLLYKALYFTTKNQDLVAVSQTLSDIIATEPLPPEDEVLTEEKPIQTPEKRLRLWGLWLLVLLVIGVGSALLYQKITRDKQEKEQIENHQIVKSYDDKPFENIIGYAENDPSAFAQAMRAYDKKEFEKAESLFIEGMKDPRSNKNNPTIQLYFGITQRLLNKLDMASKTLEKQVDDKDIGDFARFNLGLTLLKMNKRDAAKAWLIPLSKKPNLGAIQKDANLILSQLAF